MIHKADVLEGERRGVSPRPYIQVVFEGGWGALVEFLTCKNVSKCVVRVDLLSERDGSR